MRNRIGMLLAGLVLSANIGWAEESVRKDLQVFNDVAERLFSLGDTDYSIEALLPGP